jgi:hypothetical protein
VLWLQNRSVVLTVTAQWPRIPSPFLFGVLSSAYYPRFIFGRSPYRPRPIRTAKRKGPTTRHAVWCSLLSWWSVAKYCVICMDHNPADHRALALPAKKLYMQLQTDKRGRLSSLLIAGRTASCSVMGLINQRPHYCFFPLPLLPPSVCLFFPSNKL